MVNKPLEAREVKKGGRAMFFRGASVPILLEIVGNLEWREMRAGSL